MVWNYSSYVGGRILVLASMAILARLLTPEDFGLVSLALIFTMALETLKDLGVSEALMATPMEQVEEQSETVLALSVGLGIFLALLTAGLAPLAARFFDQPQLVSILPVLGLNFVLRGLGATHYAIAQKRLDFGTRTIAEAADVLLRGGVGVVLAATGFGVWSLVIGYVVGSAALTVAVWILVPWRPKFRPRRAHLSPLLRLGGALTGLNISAVVGSNVDYAFVGKLLGAASLGFYTIAFRLPQLVILNLSVVAGQVLFPAFANIDRGSLQAAYLIAFRYTILLTLPVSAGMVVLAEPLVLTLFGDKWEPAVGAMQVLVLFSFATTMDTPAGTAYKAIGRADVLLKLSIPRLILLVGGLALFTGDGLVAVGLCQAVVGALFSVAALFLASRMLRVRLLEILSTLWVPLAASAALTGVVIGARILIDSQVLELIVGGLVGGLAYLGTLLLVAPQLVWDFRDRLLPGPGGAGPQVAVAEADPRV